MRKPVPVHSKEIHPVTAAAPTDSLRIVELQIKNVQRVRAVHIKPTGALVRVEGRNRQGKTSVLRSIAMALGGKAQFSDAPLRRGEKEGEIIAKLGDAAGKIHFTITRTWTDEGREALQLIDAEGVPVKGPETFLKSLIGLGYAFDPLVFVQADPKAQAETLRRLTGLDFTDLDREREKVYAQRTLVNRDLTTAQGALRAMEAPRAGLPDKPLAVADLVAERDQRQGIIRQNETMRFGLSAHREKVRRAEAEVDEARALLERRRQERDAAIKQMQSAEAAIEQLTDPDLGPIEQQIKDVDGINAAIRARDAYNAADAKVKAHAGEADKLTERIEAIDAERRERISAADMPVAGLGFGADGLVTFNDLPLSQASDAEQFQVSTSIALSGNARAKIALINHGNELDSDGLSLLAGIVEKAGATCWIARVTDGDGDGSGFVIEDGMVKAEPQGV